MWRSGMMAFCWLNARIFYEIGYGMNLESSIPPCENKIFLASRYNTNDFEFLLQYDRKGVTVIALFAFITNRKRKELRRVSPADLYRFSFYETNFATEKVSLFVTELLQ